MSLSLFLLPISAADLGGCAWRKTPDYFMSDFDLNLMVDPTNPIIWTYNNAVGEEQCAKLW